ncbi:sulfotransferase family protein [Actinophytocola oryzae]|uniref:Sulfotransferase family protein n=1 Tax=Actinophytocola oryzae TaxID=502181 RepID=A0A4R7VKG2_9PSEU|nr:sulfotransferase family protein [Actinophytocola oryzae]TDV49735.1 hypothetical protein CLV71_10774 [Actinophytocola oryzae]
MRNLLLVLGMGRSGTSMLTGLLSLCGAALPDNLLASDANNEKGYFESLDVLTMNEFFLNCLGLDFFDTSFRLQEGELAADGAGALTKRIGKFLGRYEDRPLLVVKDPKMVPLLRYWLPAATGAGWDVKIVVTVRHPREVSASLARVQAGQADHSVSDALWIKYNLLAERDTRDFPRVVVTYDELLADWRGQLKRVTSALDVELDLGSDRDEAVDSFLDRKLRHFAADDDQVPPNPWVAAIYRQLTELSVDGALDRDRMDRLYELYVSAERMVRACVLSTSPAPRPA